MEQILQKVVGEYSWLLISGIAILLFQNTIREAVDGIMVFLGNDYNEDDVQATRYLHEWLIKQRESHPELPSSGYEIVVKPPAMATRPSKKLIEMYRSGEKRQAVGIMLKDL